VPLFLKHKQALFQLIFTSENAIAPLSVFTINRSYAKEMIRNYTSNSELALFYKYRSP